MKKLVTLLSIAALVAVAIPASAATITNTNDGSWAKISYWLGVHLTGTNTNTAEIINEVTSAANSGGNFIDSTEYQSGTTIRTGSAEAVTSVNNEANLITIDSSLDTSLFDGNNNDSIDMTNDESAAAIKQNQHVMEDDFNTNLVAVANLAASIANTGDNATTSGEELQTSTIDAGAASSGSVVTNLFNKISQTFHRVIR